MNTFKKEPFNKNIIEQLIHKALYEDMKENMSVPLEFNTVPKKPITIF